MKRFVFNMLVLVLFLVRIRKNSKHDLVILSGLQIFSMKASNAHGINSLKKKERKSLTKLKWRLLKSQLPMVVSNMLIFHTIEMLTTFSVLIKCWMIKEIRQCTCYTLTPESVPQVSQNFSSKFHHQMAHSYESADFVLFPTPVSGAPFNGHHQGQKYKQNTVLDTYVIRNMLANLCII